VHHRYSLNLRDIEERLALLGITLRYESIRRWSRRFGPQFARKLRREQGTLADHWLVDEVFVNIQGQRHYLWRAIDQNGAVINILVQRRRNARAAKRFFPKRLKGQQRSPNRNETRKLSKRIMAQRMPRP
jgi:putative transposase